jgi:hypothetical protein
MGRENVSFMPLQWFEGGKYAKMDAISTSCR